MKLNAQPDASPRPASRLHTTAIVGLAVLSMAVQVVVLGTLSPAQVGRAATPSAVKAAAVQPTATKVKAGDGSVLHVALPSGSRPCPDSGAGASCASSVHPVPEPVAAWLPPSLTPCPSDQGKPALDVPGSCDPKQAAAPAAPSAPTSLTLSTDHTALVYGGVISLVARTDMSVSGTPWAIEIFDQTLGRLVGACTTSSTCWVAETGRTGLHQFVAYVVPPTKTVPTQGILLTSQPVAVKWLGVGLVTQQLSIVKPGAPVTLTAFASEDVGKIGYVVELHEAGSGKQLTYCAQGTTCSTAVAEPAAGTYSFYASLHPRSQAGSAASAGTRSGAVFATWLSVNLDATTTHSSKGDVTWIRASANADLSQSPWSLFVYSDAGKLIGQPCKSSTCVVSTPAEPAQRFLAIVAPSALPPAATAKGFSGRIAAGMSQWSVQAQSPLVKPLNILWGVDSCKSFTSDPAAHTGLYPQVVSAYGGAPDFWGRYLTPTVCPALSSTEIAAARAKHMGILPIYNDYNCSNLIGYGTGLGYAAAATTAAKSDGIPRGTGIALDIEPPGDACPGAGFVDSSLVEGWYDGVTRAGFAPIYYGDTTAGSAFARGWCGAMAAHPQYATTAYLWSFEPSLQGSYRKASAPDFSPNGIGCGGDQSAWQYELSAGATPDVDSDEALSRLPLWFP